MPASTSAFHAAQGAICLGLPVSMRALLTIGSSPSSDERLDLSIQSFSNRAFQLRRRGSEGQRLSFP
jgi:hypothetical protein